jgi:hypothetical protein
MSKLRNSHEPGDLTPHAAAMAALYTIGIVVLLVVRGAPAPDMVPTEKHAATVATAHRVVSPVEHHTSGRRAEAVGAATESPAR